MSLLQTASLKEITPENLLRDKNITAITDALDSELQEVSQDTRLPLILPIIDELDENITDFLAQAFHCDFYDLADTLEMKHEAVKNSIKWHMKKGTVSAILDSLEALGVEADFIPWWQSGKEPYTFQIAARITGEYHKRAGKNRMGQLIRRSILDSKAARSELRELDIDIPQKGDLPLSTGIIEKSEWNYDIGVDTSEMHELLLVFERRIIERIERYERVILEHYDQKQDNISAQLDEIKALLQWADEGDGK